LVEIAALLHQASGIGRRGRERHLLVGGFRIQHHQLPHIRRAHRHSNIAAELRLRDADHLLDGAAVLRDIDAVDLLDVVGRFDRRRFDAGQLLAQADSKAGRRAHASAQERSHRPAELHSPTSAPPAGYALALARDRRPVLPGR